MQSLQCKWDWLNYTKVLYKATISISALRSRRGRYAQSFGICARSYCISLKYTCGEGGFNAARGLIHKIAIKSIVIKNMSTIIFYINCCFEARRVIKYSTTNFGQISGRQNLNEPLHLAPTFFFIIYLVFILMQDFLILVLGQFYKRETFGESATNNS